MMNERSAGLIVHLALTIHLITAQIYFPDDGYYLTSQSSASAPVQSNGWAPVQSSGWAPVQSSGSAPVQSSGRAPIQNSGRAPVQSSGRAPIQNSGRAPVQSSGRAPVQSSGRAHVQNNERVAAHSTKRTPVQRSESASVFVSESDQLVSDLTTINMNSRPQESPETIIAHSISNIVLDINRVIPTISPHLAKADNIVYGPLTISGVLALVLLASIGQTFDEIVNFMGLPSSLNIQNNPMFLHAQLGILGARLSTNTGLDIGQRVNYATAIFVQNDFPVRLGYQQASEALYGSNIMNLDFKGNPEMAQNVINTWVSGRTNMKIPSLLDDPPPQDTRAIIVGVLYFQAAWQFPFFDGHTKWRPFYANGRRSPSNRMVEMMSNGGEFPYYKDTRLGLEIMGFPYKGNQTTMYVIIPNESNKDKLRNLENSLTPGDIDRLVKSTAYTEAVTLFPKMQLESTIDLKRVLQRLGVNALFNPYQSNMALLSSGVNQRFNEPEAPFVSTISVSNNIQRPPPPPREKATEDRLIFTRFGDNANCVEVFDPVRNISECRETNTTNQNDKHRKAVPLETRSEVGVLASLENLRRQLSKNPDSVNPGLYADQVIHKVYIDITESGTEAASATGISLNRSGGRVTFRVDVPFLFFIYHEETKVILFYGSVKTPTPSRPSAGTQ